MDSLVCTTDDTNEDATACRAACHLHGYLCDVQSLKFGRSLASPSPLMLRGTTVRTLFIDQQVLACGAQRVVSLGAGFCTRPYRISDAIAWIEVDVPEVMERKRRILADDGRVTRIPWDLNQGMPDDLPPPDLAIAEAVFLYLEPDAVERILQYCRERQAGLIVFEPLATPSLLRHLRTRNIAAPSILSSVGEHESRLSPYFKNVRPVSMLDARVDAPLPSLDEYEEWSMIASQHVFLVCSQ